MVRVTANLSEFTCIHGIAIASFFMMFFAWLNSNHPGEPTVRVAMIGNSLMYYNDLPRLLESMSSNSIVQDSCLHGDASIESHLIYGNGMYEKWNTGQARMWDVDDKEAAFKEYYVYMNYTYDDDSYQYDQAHIYDYGACTVEQLLLGRDERLVEQYESGQRRGRQLQKQSRKRSRRRRLQDEDNDDDAAAGGNDDAMAAANNNDDATANDDAAQNDGDDYYKANDDQKKTYDDDVYEDKYNEKYRLENDGSNPCLLSANYYFYKQSQYDSFGTPQWDYIILNDNSRAPCCTEQRQTGLQLLKEVYVPWFIETGAIPIFMVTHAYWSSNRDMSGLVDVPTFSSLTYEGYREYAEMVAELLPEEQEPRLAPVGLAFQMIWEENPRVWESLIHMDEIHLTPSGTYLEGLIVYATIYGRLPNPRVVLNGDVANLFSNARRMTPSEHIQEAYPTLDQARYLYHIASRIVNGELPRSFIRYENGESADFVPDDESFQRNRNYNNDRR
jgi:hypothetical protein